ncbi:hypothetical protein BDV29DRAFT_160690 [Aspergillus leporis]|jgi:ubiquinone/menaquinone biosynthesis C-methylase UbiE|uniref:Methyltransferase domain-containing protein n=1 Tax=Aspergillus leporis TaxID=41062 RepID=A0A5N5WNQ8_9EURO|nr:hypothetical protein BDV29DRAFT_160690 [Aspergillus leporis]
MEGYHTSCRTESYELAHTRLSLLNKDIPIYSSAYEEMRLLRPLVIAPNSPYTSVDIGTGTGRIIRHLVSRLLNGGTNTSDEARFIGLDTSSHMLNHARQTISSPPGSEVSYHQVSALDMRTIELLNGDPSVDIFIFAKEYISSLCETDEVEWFLEEIAAVLRPGTRRAYLSLFDMSERNATLASSTYRDEAKPGVTELTSVAYRRLCINRRDRM